MDWAKNKIKGVLSARSGKKADDKNNDCCDKGSEDASKITLPNGNTNADTANDNKERNNDSPLMPDKPQPQQQQQQQPLPYYVHQPNIYCIPPPPFLLPPTIKKEGEGDKVYQPPPSLLQQPQQQLQHHPHHHTQPQPHPQYIPSVAFPGVKMKLEPMEEGVVNPPPHFVYNQFGYGYNSYGNAYHGGAGRDIWTGGGSSNGYGPNRYASEAYEHGSTNYWGEMEGNGNGRGGGRHTGGGRGGRGSSKGGGDTTQGGRGRGGCAGRPKHGYQHHPYPTRVGELSRVGQSVAHMGTESVPPKLQHQVGIEESEFSVQDVRGEQLQQGLESDIGIVGGGGGGEECSQQQLPSQVELPTDKSSELFDDLPEEMKAITPNNRTTDQWVLTPDCCQAVMDETPIGYLKDFTPSELDALFGTDGILRDKLPVNTSKHSRILKGERAENKKKSSKSVVATSSAIPVEREVLTDFHCDSKCCNVQVRVVRVKCNGVNGILVYQLINPSTGVPHEHNVQAHNMTPFEEQSQGLRVKKPATKSKYGSTSLSVAQRQFIMDFATQRSKGKTGMSNGGDIATAMISSNRVRLSEEHKNSSEKLRLKIDAHVKNRKTAGDYFFTNIYGKSKMTGTELKQILDILMTPADERESEPLLEDCYEDNFHLHTANFKQILWKHLVVSHHDHDGSTWKNIAAEYNDWKQLVANALKMFPDGKLVQLEMDFFKGISEGDVFQYGQCGFSDIGHRFFMTNFILCKSENKDSAGMLLTRALEMLNELGGDCNWVLIDGGYALEAAIKSTNSERNEDGSVTVKVLIQKRACHAHITRMGNTRGGGKRGGKGSLPRFLLDQGIPVKTMRKIIGCVFLIGHLPPSDIESYKVAIDLLIELHGDHLNDHVREKYLNGNPLCLGGHMCGWEGHVASGQGMEKLGDYLKKMLQMELSTLNNMKEQSKNPYWILLSSAKHKKYYASGTLGQVQFIPDKYRKEFFYMYKAIKELANYIPPSSQQRHTSKHRSNFSSTFLYAFVLIATGEVEESGEPKMETIPLHDAIGRAGMKDFTLVIATPSCVLTELSKLLLENSSSISGAPVELQQTRFGDSISSTEQITDVNRLSKALSELTPNKQRQLKTNLYAQMSQDTPARHDREMFMDYIYRRGQAPPDPIALDTSHVDEVGSKGRGRGKKRNQSEISSGERDMSLQEKKEEELRKDKEGCIDAEDGHENGGEVSANIPEGSVVEEEEHLDGGELVNELVQDQDKIVTPAPQTFKRVRVKKNMGDFTRTSVSATGEIKCNCGHFSYWRWCEHCVVIDVLHHGNYPTHKRLTEGSDQWHMIRSKFLNVLKEVHIK